jgi:hypothetical protein
MSLSIAHEYRFDVALSFAGDGKRLYVRAVAELLRRELGAGKVFFDEWFEAELAGHDGHIVLQNIYRKETRLVVTCVCERYNEKAWTQEEWRAIQAFERKLRDAGGGNKERLRFLPLRFGDGAVDGLFETAIVPDVRSRSPEETAGLILERWRLTRCRSSAGGVDDALKEGPMPLASVPSQRRWSSPKVSLDDEPGVPLVLLALRRDMPSVFASRLPGWMQVTERDVEGFIARGAGVLVRLEQEADAIALFETLRADSLVTFLSTRQGNEQPIRRGPGGIALGRVAQHERSVWWGVHPITVDQFRRERERSWTPVSHVSWNEVRAWIDRLNESHSGSGFYRLPTEDEWHHVSEDLASLAGDDPMRFGWLEAVKPHEVGKYRPNRWGMLDLVGNVAEWTTSPHERQAVCGGSFASNVRGYSVHAVERLGVNERASHVGFRLIWEGELRG